MWDSFIEALGYLIVGFIVNEITIIDIYQTYEDDREGLEIFLMLHNNVLSILFWPLILVSKFLIFIAVWSFYSYKDLH